LISIRAGSSTRGPIPLGQRNSKIGPNRTALVECLLDLSIAARVVGSGTTLKTSRLTDGTLRQYVSLASMISSTPTVWLTNR
jgi:ABC-type Fe2+-enterobactin transport system substrate-binding protein